MRRQLAAAATMSLVLTVLTGLAYPLLVTGLAQMLFHDGAEGSFVKRDGKLVGSRLIGQPFTDAGYFHPRPSAAGRGYDASRSSGSNLGPTNPEFLASVEDRIDDYRARNGLTEDTRIPVDAVTASASGLDPHISVANARLQARRVAGARGLALEAVLQLIDDHVTGRDLGFLGETAVNVLELNLALDELTH